MKKHRWIIPVILVGVALGLFIQAGLFLYLTFGAEERVIRNTIDNPHVNDKFNGWEHIDSEEYGCFRLPQNWTFCEEDNLFRILDDEGNEWAVGTWQGEGDYPDRSTFLQAVFPKDGNFAECTYDPESVYMNGCSVGSIGTDGQDSAPIYFLELRKEYDHNIFLVIVDPESTGNDTYHLAEAIAYAYAYKK